MATSEPLASGTDQSRIFVTGSTGELGRRVIAALLKRVSPDRIVAGVRSPDHDVAKQFVTRGVEVRVADYTQLATLVAAFEGIDRLLLISSNADEGRLAQHESVIDAAKASNVKLLAYTSLLHADKSKLRFGDDHRRTEAALTRSGLPHVLLRHGWYTENHMSLIPTALKSGAIFGCAGDGRFSTATRDDFAAAAAAILSSPGQAGRVYELAGDESYSLAELATAVAAAAGTSIVYKNMTEADYRRTLTDFKLPEAVADLIAEADVGASRGELEDSGYQLSNLIGRPTAALEDSVKRAVSDA